MSIPRLSGPASTDAIQRMSAVRVAVVDVGANTVRLLVANTGGAVHEERAYVGLGDEVERSGRLSAKRIDAAASAAAACIRRARKLRCAWIEILVTSPGRQSSNGEQLVAALHEATDAPVRVLSAEEEGALAWRGAVAATAGLPETVAVCDVGGGSAQVGVGTPRGSPAWVRSVDVGSLRLTRRAFRNDPPDAADLARAQWVLADAFAELAPPLPLAAIAVGGTARGLRRVVGGKLTQETLLEAVRKLAKRSSRRIAKDFGVNHERARTLTAGALIVLEVQRRVEVPLRVGRGGLREGAAQALLETAVAAVG